MIPPSSRPPEQSLRRTRPPGVTLANWDLGGEPSYWAYLHTNDLLPSIEIPVTRPVTGLESAEQAGIGRFPVEPGVSLDEYVAAGPVSGIVIVHGGTIVFERYPRMRPDDRHLLMSVAKVFPAAIAGILELRGELDLAMPVDAVIDELAGSGWAGVPVSDVLGMASGIDCLEIDSPGAYTDPDHPYYRFEACLGWRPGYGPSMPSAYEYVAGLRSHRRHGEAYEYTGANTFVLSWLIERVTGLPFAQVLDREIWSRAGFEAPALLCCSADGAPASHGGLCLTLRDLARFGMLFTPSSSRVADDQVISAEHVRRIQAGGRPSIHPDQDAARPGYISAAYGSRLPPASRQWNFAAEDGDLFKGGFGGQGLYVSPARDLVIAFAGIPGADGAPNLLRWYSRRLAVEMALTRAYSGPVNAGAPAPSGTVTLLFTDIEGSTKLWEADSQLMAGALRQHDQILRAAIQDADGYVFKTVGDAFCAAFGTPQQAVQAVLTAQRRLDTEQWTTARPIRVRMALHTGVCEERDDDYFGPVVNRTARLEGIAHGGQVLVSGATAELLAGNLPDGIQLRDLGPHRLRDLGRPEQVFQLESGFLRAAFPPLESLDNPELPNNLPSLLSVFVGRQAELGELRELVKSWRLVTLAGAGGCGKTRLALQAAAEMLDGSSDGVWFVELAPVTDGSQIPAAVAAALGVPEPGSLMAALREYDAFLLLDNCEHVIDAAAAFCGQVVRDCPNVRMLTTSREPLGIDGERVYRVASLTLPPPEAEDIADFDAISLFVQRARAHDASFALDGTSGPLVASICRRLDGIPLALELAAARLSSMSLVHLSQRLDQRFRLLTGGSRNVMPRQQTLQATVDWSFDLLTEAERAMLRRLSVFSGGFELEAAEAICVTEQIDVYEVADLLGSLVAKSLVVADRKPDSVRYRLLETIRQYAAGELLRSDLEAEVLRIRDRHADFYLRLAQEPDTVRRGPRQGEWLRRLDLEWENIRLAVTHLESGQRVSDIFRLVVGLDRFLASRGHVEALTWLKQAIEAADPAPDPLLSRGLCTYAALTQMMQPAGAPDRVAANGHAERALEVARTLGDLQLVAEALAMLSILAFADAGDPVRGRQLCEEGMVLAQQVGDKILHADLLDTLSLYAASEEESRRFNLAALDLARETGDVFLAPVVLSRLFWLDMAAGRLREARGYIERAVAAAEEIGGEMLLAWFRTDLVLLDLIEGEREKVLPMVRGLLLTARRVGTGIGACEVLVAAACCASWQGEYVKAARLFGTADAALVDMVAFGRVGWSSAKLRLRDAEYARLRELMGDAEFEAAFRAGATLSRLQAVEVALDRARA